ncbi:PEGA domain-containing protein [Stigmatella sp. ncwal1]|uniref:PEGA domain-containing protein n=1 Tax=Stigmatella ashevillensis TaxID=2995309 RepID=A0ABT5CZQ4_9BACT|nr:PEGA domain-containing protein [Stigmatella ashevillena]MDC0706917.1 PEGA domain-containing protein [Stigmatella ashevillena]
MRLRVASGLVLVLGGLGCASRQEESVTMAQARKLMRGAESQSGNVILRCEPPEAEVALDGVTQGVCSDFQGTPRGLQVGQGLHQIEVRMEGHWPSITYLEPQGARTTLNVRLESKAGPAP